MADLGSRRGAVNLAIPLMILSFAVIAGFLWWLSENAVAPEVAIEEAPADTPAGPVVAAVDPMLLQAPPDSLVGRELRLEEVSVASRLGDQSFWIELPNRNPFLVHMGPDVTAAGVSVAPENSVEVTGTLHAMSDSVLTAWVSGGVIAQAQRIEAEFATHFIEAGAVNVMGAAPAGEGEGEGGG